MAWQIPSHPGLSIAGKHEWKRRLAFQRRARWPAPAQTNKIRGLKGPAVRRSAPCGLWVPADALFRGWPNPPNRSIQSHKACQKPGRRDRRTKVERRATILLPN